LNHFIYVIPKATWFTNQNIGIRTYAKFGRRHYR